jgi:XTP/dITP diphosphohydrolase
VRTGVPMGSERDWRKILVATGNSGKFREIQEVLGAGTVEIGSGVPQVRWLSLRDLPEAIAEPEETEATFSGNAALKAHHYARASGLWTLADDSGLEVDALGGAPGVMSARYAGAREGTPRAEVDRANNRRLIAELQGVPPERRMARFRCALALSDGERLLVTAEGRVEARIIDEARGSNGFGYDPHFYLVELGRTMAELRSEEKNRISHRGQALRVMRERLEVLIRESGQGR